MRRKEHSSPISAHLPLADLQRWGRTWVVDGESRRLSPSTIATRRLIIEKLIWFHHEQALPGLDRHSLREFFAYLNREPAVAGRWGNARNAAPVKSSTAKTYFIRVQTFCAFLVAEGILDDSPMARMELPEHHDDQVQPFTMEQVTALLKAAAKSKQPRRDRCICLMLLDTGARVSELCGLQIGSLEMSNRSLRVTGKGDKERTLYFGAETSRAIWAHLRENDHMDLTPHAEKPLFAATAGRKPGSALTRSGALQLMERLGEVAKIPDSLRCSPHTFRHTFAITFLRNGGNIFTLQALLGHTDLKMCRKYLALSQADLEAQHRQFSPVDGMHNKKR